MTHRTWVRFWQPTPFMKPVEVTMDNLEALVRDSSILVLDFWASGCAPCRAFAPVFEQAAMNHPDIVFGKVNTESDPAVAAAFAIRSIPSLVVFRERLPVFYQSGMLQGPALEELLRQVRSLDMAKVQEEYDKHMKGVA